MGLEKIYDRAPVFFQNLLVSMKGRQIHKIRYGSTSHMEARRVLEANEHVSPEALREIQFRRLCSFVEHCHEASPYYRRKFEMHGLLPRDIKEPRDIARIPITSKADLRAQTEAFFTRTIDRRLVAVHTSGTTGSPMTVYFSPQDIGMRFAFLERCRRWAGVRVGQRRASFTGQSIVPERQNRAPFWRYNRPGNQLLFSSYHLAPDHLPAYAQALKKFDPEIIEGYPSSIHVVAEYLLRNGLAGVTRPGAVLVSAETVLPHQRAAIEKAFRAKLYNQYASSEGAPFISECAAGRLHVHLDSGFVEILKPDGAPARPGESGELVVSSFTTHVTPLLRYAIGDVAVPAAASDGCACGLPFPVIEMVVGRVDDILCTPDRGYVGRLDTVFKKLPNSVVEAQIIQASPELILLRLVPDRQKYQAAHAALLIAEMRKRLGNVVEIEVEEVAHIPRSANGKMRAVINRCLETVPPSLRYSPALAELAASPKVKPAVL
jgi:phenylacetate-CoA ligase